MLRLLCAFLTAIILSGCSGGAASTTSPSVVTEQSPTPSVVRRGFLGAFFRSVGPPPFGVFSVYSKQRAPEPYPKPTSVLFGKNGYCDAVADNGVSLSTGYAVDKTKLANIVDLGVKWTRTEVSSNYDDQSHFLGAGKYAFSDFDSAQCALLRHHILPIVGIEVGTVQYNAVPGTYSPGPLPNYKTAADFGQWCGVVAAHERATFPAVSRFSEPGNEVNNTDPKSFPGGQDPFPGGEAQLASYTEACYHAIKTAMPSSTVYGFELDMDRHLDPPAFIERMYGLGCKLKTCYDALSIHLFMRYPLPADTDPCFPGYGPQCIVAIQTAARAPQMHVLVGESAFTIPGSVPDEAAKAQATVEEMKRLAANKLVDGVLYANVDECDLYPSGFFVGGCLVDSEGNKLPAYTALATLAHTNF